jgi:hypothetical protein
MTPEDLKILQEKVGADAAAAMKKELDAYDEKAKKLANEAASKSVTAETFETFKTAANEALEGIKKIAEKQGTSLQELSLKLTSASIGEKSIAQVLSEDEEDLRKVFSAGSGSKSYMVLPTEKGYSMKPFDPTMKTVGPVASISGINGGTAASIFQSIDAASLLRLGGDSVPIIGQYRNSKWILDLCNVTNADYKTYMAMWFEEVAKTGTSATVAEGGLKPLVQYGYTLKTATYKKEAALVGFTDEFALDFSRLQSDILGTARIDVLNRINTAVLGDIIAAATAYNTGASYKTARGGAIATNYNDYLAIDAMAAQVDNATFGQQANAAVMSTFRNHALNSQMDAEGRFLTPPVLLQNLNWVGNPAMAVDDVLVGDFKQFNIILRGGLIVRVGYNGTDFAQNMFSVAVEQYYYDYISPIRAVAIVKGATFAAVKTAITT